MISAVGVDEPRGPEHLPLGPTRFTKGTAASSMTKQNSQYQHPSPRVTARVCPSAETCRKSALPVLVGVLALAVPVQGASIVGLGYIDDGIREEYSAAFGVSADGTVVVGAIHGPGNIGHEPFRWTSGTGLVGLGDFPDGEADSEARGISADGTTVVGYGSSPLGYEPFRSTGAGLGRITHVEESVALGVSGNGNVVVGTVFGSGGDRAFRWTLGSDPDVELPGLGVLPSGYSSSIASGVSDDGERVVGLMTGGDNTQAFLWMSGSGIIGLGDLEDGDENSVAYGISADGTVVVGEGASPSGIEAFRWTQTGGMEGLGDLAGGDFSSKAFGVSGNGDWVVGVGTGVNGDEAFLWADGTGMLTLAEVLGGKGVDLSHWTQLIDARAISPDGRWVVGTGLNLSGKQEAFLADLSGSPPGVPEGGPLALLTGLTWLGILALERRRVA